MTEKKRRLHIHKRRTWRGIMYAIVDAETGDVLESRRGPFFFPLTADGLAQARNVRAAIAR